MQNKLTYTVSRTFETPDGASDEEYEAMKDAVIASIVGDRSNNEVEGTVKVERLDTTPVQPPKYETNMDSEKRKIIINKVGQCIARVNGMSPSCYMLYAENSAMGHDLHIWEKDETKLIDTVEYTLGVTVPTITALWNKTLGDFVNSFAGQLSDTSDDWCQPAVTPPPDDSKMKDAPFTIEDLRLNRRNDKSFYVIKFDIDQRDADYITVSTSPIKGFPTKTELARLCVMANYRDLSCYDGAWWDMDKIGDALDEYLHGSFYDTCNRFKIKDISVWGYDANTKSFYDMDLPEPDELGISLDEAYEQLFRNE